MDIERTLLQAIHQEPGDDLARLALADWLEGEGRSAQAELTRLHLKLRQADAAPGLEFVRLCQFLDVGVRPVVPTVLNDLGMTFALIPPGRVWMGSPPEEASRFDDEGPLHLVEITKPFYLGVYPVTQREYTAVMEVNPSYFSATGDGAGHVHDMDTDWHPVDHVSWDLATTFCVLLSRATGQTYRLPTEAEWEYACRAGVSHGGPFHHGPSLSSYQANFDGRDPFGDAAEGPYLRRTVRVDRYPPNAFGLYDLHGNVSEWCQDWFAQGYYSESPRHDPAGPDDGEHRVLRGGSWTDPGKYCRAAFRYDRPPEERRRDFGMRVVLEYG